MSASGIVTVKFTLRNGRWHWSETRTVHASTSIRDELDAGGIAEYEAQRLREDAWEQGQDVEVKIEQVTVQPSPTVQLRQVVHVR